MVQWMRLSGIGVLVAAALSWAPLPAAAQTQPAGSDDPLDRGGSFTYRDPRIGTLPARSYDLFLTRPGLPERSYGPLSDPKFKTRYDHRLQLRCATGENENLRKFVIHYQRTEDQLLARRVGTVMARLYWIVSDYLGVGPTRSQYVDVWLAREGEAGAEAYRDSTSANIYLYAIDEPRAPAEWVRELAHEYSHLYLPKIGTYTAPEPNANGYLGERLLLKWLLYDNRMTDVWGEEIDGAAYVANQVEPLRSRFLNEGPEGSWEALNAAAMDRLIGAFLAIEHAFGPKITSQLLERFSKGSPHPRNLGGNMTLLLRDLKPAQLTLDPLACIPTRSQLETPPAAGAAPRFQKAAYWIFLPGGTWQFDLQGTVPENSTVTLESAKMARSPAAAPGAVTFLTTLSTANGVWRRLELAAPAGQSLELRAIRITRQDGTTAPRAFPAAGPGAGFPAPAPRVPTRAPVLR